MDPFGRVYLEFVVAATDDQRFDLWFEPSLELWGPCPRYLRMVSRMARAPCAVESFSSTPGSEETLGCVRKQLNWHHVRVLTAKSKGQAAPPLCPLWVLSPGHPRTELQRRRARRAKGWPRGVYWTDDASQLWFVVLSELPCTRETLVLRLLGTAHTREQALAQLRRIPADDAELPGLLRLVSALRVAVAHDITIEEKDREDFMTNAMMEVLKMEQTWFQQGRDQGVSQGAQEAMAQAVLMTLEARGLNVDDMSRQRVLSCHDLPTLKRWIVKAATAPRIEDVLA